MDSLAAIAPAKLNLYLHIHGKRPDGYHLIESLAVFTAFGDTVRVSPAASLSLVCEGEFATAAGEGADNLVMKAARLLQQKTQSAQGAAIQLGKHVPVGAGLGGGSSDAAVVLKLLNAVWKLNVPKETLCAWGAELGADVPMCIRAQPVIAEGIGERLTPLGHALPPLHVVMVHPRTPLLTKDVYAALAAPQAANEAQPPAHASLAPCGFDDFVAWLAAQRNDLEPAAQKVSADIARVQAALRGVTPAAPLVRMSGSGACCYALYPTEEGAFAAAQAMQAAHPTWWVRASALAA